ncbi:hypothetical protein TNCV_2916651 [Trichonephila clavipes]|nr:hypothetical protein TNCV_2916651 [Trichonephila clavipes]
MVSPTYHFHRADWDKFTRLSDYPGTMSRTGQLMQQSSMSLKLFECCRCSYSQNIQFSSKAVQTMVERFRQQAKKEAPGVEGVGIFRRYPTSDNLIAFKFARKR